MHLVQRNELTQSLANLKKDLKLVKLEKRFQSSNNKSKVIQSPKK